MFSEGMQIGPYHLIRKLGRGGFGEVWLAERRAKFVTTKVAIKMPLDKTVDPETIKQEAVLWEQASGHPNVLPIIEADEYDGQIVIVSEYATDGSLDELLEKEKTLSVRKSVEMTIDILKGLDFLHSRQIIHRDIKPANVLLQGDTPRLTDFGISRVVKTTDISLNISGTPSYMAPEAFDRKRTVQTDIWSVGVVLYRMLTGYLPFAEGSLTDLLGSIVKGEPQPFPDVVPGELRRIILKALAKRPDERYQTTRAMSNDLTKYLVSISKGDVEMTIKDHALLKTLPMDGRLETKEDLRTDAVARRKDTQKSWITSRRIGLLGLLAILLAGSAGGYIFYKRYNSNPTGSTTVKKVRLIPFRKGDKFGFCDENKKLVIEAKYDNARPFSEGLAVVNIGRETGPKFEDRVIGKYGVIDQTGKEVVPLKYDSITDFKNGLAIVSVDAVPTKIVLFNGKFGLIDRSGREVVPPQYDRIGEFVDGFAQAVLDRKLGYINEKGALAIPLIYGGSLSDFNSGNFSGELAAVNKGRQEYLSDRGVSVPIQGKYGYIDMAGQEVIPFKFDGAGPFSFSSGLETPNKYLAAVTIDKRCGYIDRKGDFNIPAKYDDCGKFSEGLASVEVNKKWGFIDTNGNEVISPKYDGTSEFHESLAAVGIGDPPSTTWGFINKSGEEVIQPKYIVDFQRIEFHDGLANVCFWTGELRFNNPYLPKVKCGFIDKNGNEVIPLKYDGRRSLKFTGDLILVQLDGKTFYIDRNGVEYYEP